MPADLDHGHIGDADGAGDQQGDHQPVPARGRRVIAALGGQMSCPNHQIDAEGIELMRIDHVGTLVTGRLGDALEVRNHGRQPMPIVVRREDNEHAVDGLHHDRHRPGRDARLQLLDEGFDPLGRDARLR